MPKVPQGNEEYNELVLLAKAKGICVKYLCQGDIIEKGDICLKFYIHH